MYTYIDILNKKYFLQLDSSIQSDKFDKHFEIADDKFADVHTNLLKKIGHERVKIMKLQKDLSKYLVLINSPSCLSCCTNHK